MKDKIIALTKILDQVLKDNKKNLLSPQKKQQPDSFLNLLKQEKANMDRVVRESRQELIKFRRLELQTKNKPQVFEMDQRIQQMRCKIQRMTRQIRKVANEVDRIENFDVELIAQSQFQKFQKLKYEFFLVYNKNKHLQKVAVEVSSKLKEMSKKTQTTDQQYSQAIETAKIRNLNVGANYSLVRKTQIYSQLAQKVQDTKKSIFVIQHNYQKRGQLLQRQLKRLEKEKQQTQKQIIGKNNRSQTILVDIEGTIQKTQKRGRSLNEILNKYSTRRKTIDVQNMRGKSTVISRVQTFSRQNHYQSTQLEFLQISQTKIQPISTELPSAQEVPQQGGKSPQNKNSFKSSRISFHQIVNSRKVIRRKKTKFTEELEMNNYELNQSEKDKERSLKRMEARSNQSRQISIKQSIHSAELLPPSRTFDQVKKKLLIRDSSNTPPQLIRVDNSNEFINSQNLQKFTKPHKQIDEQDVYYNEAFEPESHSSSLKNIQIPITKADIVINIQSLSPVPKRGNQTRKRTTHKHSPDAQQLTISLKQIRAQEHDTQTYY